MAQRASPENFQRGVENYLKNKGYINTLESLQYECSLQDKEAQVQAVEQASGRQHILLQPRDDPKAYSEQYSQLRQFVSGASLDAYKMELEQALILILIFILIFIFILILPPSLVPTSAPDLHSPKSGSLIAGAFPHLCALLSPDDSQRPS